MFGIAREFLFHRNYRNEFGTRHQLETCSAQRCIVTSVVICPGGPPFPSTKLKLGVSSKLKAKLCAAHVSGTEYSTYSGATPE